MKTPRKKPARPPISDGSSLFEHLSEEGWTYIQTVVDVVHEPILILNKDLCVLKANESFYEMFQVLPEDTTDKNVYELGNGQWNIPALRKLLEDVLPTNSFFRGFEVTHQFPIIGRKVMMLNAREIHFKKGSVPGITPPIILLAIEDITEMMVVAERLASHANGLESKFLKQTKKLDSQIKALEKDLKLFKERT